MPILEARTVHWPDETACATTAQWLASRNGISRAFIELHGSLGAGKTTFTRHLLRALGVSGHVRSPTYALMESYALPGLEAWHFDFYRFEDPQEFEDAGFRDIFASPGLKLAEWPERAVGLLPVCDLRIEIMLSESHGADAHSDTHREVRIEARTPLGVELLSGP
jgi:tRNA threonylcarbamoyladenosine biosynthesis protein TsaE